MILFLHIWNSSFAQRIETDFTLSAAAGSVSNTYLMSGIPEWDRSRISGYTSLTPSGQLRWRGSGRSATLFGAGHLLHFYDDRPAWTGGYLTPVVRQQLSSAFSARATGGWSYYSSTYNRDLKWLYAGLDWTPSPFSKLEITAGSGWRSYHGHPNRPEETRRYDTYGIEFQYWPGYRWQLLTSFYSSLVHIDRPADGFAVSAAVAHYPRGGMTFTLQTGLEQYSVEFQQDPGNNLPLLSGLSHSGFPYFSSAQTMQMQDVETIKQEDRFHRTSLHVSRPFKDMFTLTGSLSGLLWFSSADNDIVPDFHISAGVQVPLSIPVSRSGGIRSINWETQILPEEQLFQTTLTVQYRGDAALYITGDFTDWDDPGIPLHKTGRNRYRVEIDLSVGVYDYKIGKLTNDRHEWLELPDNVPAVNDGFGGQNGRIFIDY